MGKCSKRRRKCEKFFDSKTLWKFLSQWVSKDEARLKEKLFIHFNQQLQKNGEWVVNF